MVFVLPAGGGFSPSAINLGTLVAGYNSSTAFT